MSCLLFISTVFLITFVGISEPGWFSDKVYGIGSYFGEVCHSPSISFKPADLERNLESQVFGQPFIQKLIIPLLKLHLSDAPRNRKALVFSFHGTPGSGKNYVSKIIAESVYEKGMDSKFVHLFKPVLHFSGGSPEILKLRLQEWILGNITKCERQLFIFDEVNDMPEGILEAVKGFIDYNPRFGGLDFSKSIFIFLSNIAMIPINQRVLELWQGGTKQRELMEYEDFSQIIIEHSFNVDGGFKKCKLISSRLIDAFVPFLPLERPHVESCIRVIAREYSRTPIRQDTLEFISRGKLGSHGRVKAGPHWSDTRRVSLRSDIPQKCLIGVGSEGVTPLVRHASLHARIAVPAPLRFYTADMRRSPVFVVERTHTSDPVSSDQKCSQIFPIAN